MAAAATKPCSRRGHLAPARKHAPFASHGFRVAQAAAEIRAMNVAGGLLFSLAPPGGQAETAQAQRVLSWDQVDFRKGVFPLLKTTPAGDWGQFGAAAWGRGLSPPSLGASGLPRLEHKWKLFFIVYSIYKKPLFF